MRRWWFPLTLIFLIALFAVVVIQRDRIRAHWWAYRLAHDDSVSQRGYYLSCIAAVGTAGTGAIESLTQANDPDVRSLAIFALRNLAEDRGIPGLAHLLADADQDVREAAALGLAFKNSPAATEALRTGSTNANPRIATAALTGLARLETAEAISYLCAAPAKQLDPFVRAQAAESLGEYLLSARGNGIEEKPKESDIRPAIVALMTALSDNAMFTGELSLERQIRVASSFASARPEPSAKAKQRKVSDIAAHWLSKITDHEIPPTTTQPATPIAELADQYYEWYSHSPQESFPPPTNE